jgi:three-Cys-motif partner protein
LKASEELPALADDHLETEDIGPWGEAKYRLVHTYAEMFAQAMRGKWDSLVYVDLFAGSGRAKIRESGKIIPASPFLALRIIDGFNKFIFCDKDPAKIRALEARVRLSHGDADCSFLEGDANDLAGDVLHAMPTPGRGRKVLGLCFSDPYSLSNLKFETIRALKSRFLDHLILIPTGMDATRNLASYLKPDNRTVDDFLGNSNWRDRWPAAERRGMSFEAFLTDEFARSMGELDYLYPGIEQTELIRSTPQNLPLYRLALFSRSKLGTKFWKQARKYSTQQRGLFD